MTRTIVAHEQALAKVFSDDFVFRIPGYQRPYAWTTEQARELLDDLLAFMQAESGAVEDMAPYFLGSIVLIKQEASPGADVVDGQQRLTTLTLLLSAIRANVESASASEVTPLIYEKGAPSGGPRIVFAYRCAIVTRSSFRPTFRKKAGSSSS